MAGPLIVLKKITHRLLVRDWCSSGVLASRIVGSQSNYHILRMPKHCSKVCSQTVFQNMVCTFGIDSTKELLAKRKMGAESYSSLRFRIEYVFSRSFMISFSLRKFESPMNTIASAWPFGTEDCCESMAG
jgi:hypothetical protein